MTTSDQDGFVAVQQVIVSWEEGLTDCEHKVAEIRSASEASAGSLRGRLEAVRGGHAAPGSNNEAEVAETRDALMHLRGETRSARQHVDQVYDRLSREVHGWRAHIHELHEQLQGPSVQVDHAVTALHAALEEHHQATDAALGPLHDHLADSVPATAHALSDQVSGAVGGLESRITGEWLPALEGAVHTLSGMLDHASDAVTQHTHEAQSDSHQGAEELTRQVESRSHDHVGHTRERAREASTSLSHSAEAVHAAGATALEGTQALHLASTATTAALNAALGILTEVKRLFDRLP